MKNHGTGVSLRVAIGFKRAVIGFRGPSAALFLQMYGASTRTWVLVLARTVATAIYDTVVTEPVCKRASVRV